MILNLTPILLYWGKIHLVKGARIVAIYESFVTYGSQEIESPVWRLRV
jgi:hypothetical protein